MDYIFCPRMRHGDQGNSFAFYDGHLIMESVQDPIMYKESVQVPIMESVQDWDHGILKGRSKISWNLLFLQEKSNRNLSQEPIMESCPGSNH